MNVDNVTASACGDVFVAEDPGQLRIVALTPSGDVKPARRSASPVRCCYAAAPQIPTPRSPADAQ